MSTSTPINAGGALPESTQTLLPDLPDDVALNILARVPRSHHPFLSTVSKSFRSLLSSPIFYATRSIVRSSEHFLYLCVRISGANCVKWFTLCRNTLNPRNPRNLLVSLPATASPLVGSAFAAAGHKIYVIGGSIEDVASSHVWAFDCRVRTWEAVSSMHIPREFPAAGVVDGKIYVIGGSVVDSWSRSRNWAEVFDPVTEKWDSVESPSDELLRAKWMHASAVIGGRIYAMADRNGVVYEPRNRKWRNVEKRLDLGWRGRACVVDDILYCYDYLGKIQGFDSGKGMWKEVKGLEKKLPNFLCGATMANLGGKLVVIWEGKGGGKMKEMEIWCAEIELEKKGEDDDDELWGNVEWCEVVHKVPVGSSIVHCLDVTL
ncbi:F-box/kelch-repeat protein SKIP6 [Linum perenne]